MACMHEMASLERLLILPFAYQVLAEQVNMGASKYSELIPHHQDAPASIVAGMKTMAEILISWVLFFLKKSGTIFVSSHTKFDFFSNFYQRHIEVTTKQLN